jgi:hypothetical protein
MMKQFKVQISEEAEQRFKQMHLTLQNRNKLILTKGQALELMVSMLHSSLEKSYSEMDRNEEIRKQTNTMEKMILGEKGVGILDALGMTPSKIQKHLDTWIEEDDESGN